jgi:8-hydroxy-5-deazaflavin:NADPH oxidoreductase
MYGRLAEAKVKPCNLWCGDEETRPIVEQLNRDAGYDPLFAGPIENAEVQEGLVKLIFAVGEGMGPFFYRFAPIGEFL